ncbi:hypothetical protein [Streptomyces plumbiresistens]|uniref:Uncharacterized protein n=1 Tax=Streptomyces plumbiresistens TaxID=511811 RepID=A0ABP7RN98_9ACTN
MRTDVRFLGNGLTLAGRLSTPGTRARRLAEHGFDTARQGGSEGADSATDIAVLPRDGLGDTWESRGVDEIARYDSFTGLERLAPRPLPAARCRLWRAARPPRPASAGCPRSGRGPTALAEFTRPSVSN